MTSEKTLHNFVWQYSKSVNIIMIKKLKQVIFFFSIKGLFAFNQRNLLYHPWYNRASGQPSYLRNMVNQSTHETYGHMSAFPSLNPIE